MINCDLDFGLVESGDAIIDSDDKFVESEVVAIGRAGERAARSKLGPRRPAHQSKSERVTIRIFR